MKSEPSEKTTDSARRIAILGTSSSVMKAGWASHFLKIIPESWTVSNFSFGGSNAMFMPAQEIVNEISRNFDLCIIELPVNDQRYIDFGFFELDVFAATIAGLFNQFTQPSARCVPLVLSMSRRQVGPFPDGDDATLVTLDRLCGEFNFRTFDVSRHIRKACVETNRQYSDYYSDGLHLKPIVQRHAALALKRWLVECWPKKTEFSTVVAHLSPKFGVVRAGEFVSSSPLEERKTSLTAMDVVTLQRGENLEARVSGHVVGLMHWSDLFSEEVVVKAVDGDQKVVQKQLRKEWEWGIFFFSHFESPIETRTGVVVTSGKQADLPVERAINPSKVEGHQPARNQIGFVLYSDRDLAGTGRLILEQLEKSCRKGKVLFSQNFVNQLKVMTLD